MKFLVLITLVCLAVAVAIAEENEAKSEVEDKFAAGGRRGRQGTGRAGYRGDSSKTSLHGKKNAFGESASENKQDYDKKSQTVIVKSEEESKRVSENEQKRESTSGASGGKHDKNKSEGGIFKKRGRDASNGVGYEKDESAWKQDGAHKGKHGGSE